MSSRKVERTIQLLVNGGIDTKTNPKLLQPPALLELENMYQLRTGELRPRNGASKLTSGGAGGFSITGSRGLFLTNQGGLGTIGSGWQSLGYNVALRFSNSAALPGWLESSGVNSQVGTGPYPAYTASLTGIPLGQTFGSSVPLDAVDADMCITAGFRAVTWSSGAASANAPVDIRALTTGASGSTSIPFLGAGKIPKIAATGGNWMAGIGANTTNLVARTALSGQFQATQTPVTNLDAALPWFDIKAIPGTNNFALAWKVTAAGGVSCAIYNPSAGTVTSTVTTAAADASFCMGWLDDQFSTGNMYLATAGSTAGVVVRTMSATTMVVSATNVIDATATANVRNVTGHLVVNATNYAVLWDIAGSSAVFDKIQLGRWTGSAAVTTIVPNHSLYSRSGLFPDGTHYVVGCFGSVTQPLLSLFSCDTQITQVTAAQCCYLSGEAGPRRQQSSLASPVINGSTVMVPAIRSRKITVPTGGTAQGLRLPVVATFSLLPAVTKGRELGGTVFVPGGILQREDGYSVAGATFPIYPEPPTGSTAVGGGMTASGTYLYRVVFRSIDSAGRISRSAGSTPLSLTLGAGDGQTTVNIFNLKVAPGDNYFTQGAGFGAVYAELYRRGPTASGATLYNKVAEVQVGTVAGDTTAVSDVTSDANAALGEVAYFNGNVIENFNPPSHTLLEVNGNRVGIVNAEDTTEFWYSKEYKAGTGIGFYPDFKVRISGDGAGGLTALAAMDGRWILFKRSAIYVLSGDGPNDLGQGSFNNPQAVSRNLGTVNPSSVVETPDGIMFQSLAGGIWLLGRGLGVEYVGKGVEQYALAESVAGASLVASLNTVRFVMPSGRMLEWDYFHKRWYTHQLRVDRSGSASTVVDCANSPVHGWCYLLANGDLMQEVAGSTSDTNGTTTGIVPRVGLPVLQLSLGGYERFKNALFTFDVLGNHTFSVDAEYNYSGALTGTPRTIAVTTATPTAQVEYNPPEGLAKCTAARIVATVTGSPTAGTFRLTGVSVTVAYKKGNKVPPSSRLT